ncbi:MAG: NAD(P)/FAD-dependent oxidoreductase [Chloroflexota bacterium]
MNAGVVVIIGAGPAGISAAIQLKRYGIEALLLEKARVGGLLWNANLVENYPGFPEGIPGPKLVALFERQMERIGVGVTRDEVLKLDFNRDRFLVKTRVTQEQADFVIVASGTKPRPFPVDVPVELHGKIYTDVWPLLHLREKHILVVGAGDAAFDYALNLARQNRVTLMNRSTETRCLPLLYERTIAHSQISHWVNAKIKAITQYEAGAGMQLCCMMEDGKLVGDYLVFAIGREPQQDFISPGLGQQEETLIQQGRLYYVGDVCNGLYRQTSIATGDGLRAAMKIYTKIRNDA